MKEMLIASNGSGYQIDKCLDISFFKDSIDCIVSDRQCGALDVAKKHAVDHVNLSEKNSLKLNTKILNIAVERKIGYIISAGFTRIFRGELLKSYQNKLFNCHPSILPAFRGFYDIRDTKKKYHARKIFERTIDFGSRVTGNTIHVVSENVDEGVPIIVSTLNIPFNEDVKYTRHHLFIQECKTLLQFVSWINQDRLGFDDNNYPFIKDAKFSEPYYSPNIENEIIINFDLKYPWR